MLIDVDGEPLILNVLVYVFDCCTPNLLGSDIMHYLRAKIDFGQMAFFVGGRKFALSVGKSSMKTGAGKIHFHSVCDKIIPGRACQQINIVLDSEPTSAPFVLVGNSTETLAVVDSVYDSCQEQYTAVVLNMSDGPISIKHDFKLGYVMVTDEENNVFSVSDYMEIKGEITEEIIDEVREEIKGKIDGNVGVGNERVIKGEIKEQFRGEINGGDIILTAKCDLGEVTREVGGIDALPDRRKLTAAALDRFYESGGVVPITAPTTEARKPGVREKIDRGTELKKGVECKNWESREKFLENFEWLKMTEELNEDVGKKEAELFTERLKSLFWDFRHVFWNQQWSTWTLANSKPLEYQLVANPLPKIDKYRQMSDEKKELLKAYMGNLEAAGVIETAKGSPRFCANPHMVRERRETASGYVFKWRFTIDYRQQNSMCRALSYRMPLMGELLKEASSNGKYFASFDLCSYFFQLPISEKSQEITTFFLFERQMQWRVTPMGNAQSPILAQGVTDRVVDHAVTVMGYLDDFLPYALTLGGIYTSIESFLLSVSHF